MQFALSQAAWGAFRSPTPESWAALLRYDTAALPFLRPAILRHLEEYPAPVTGLTRTERFILEMVYTGIATPMALFHLFAENEEAAFMGDWSFYRVLEDLAFASEPLVRGLPDRFPTFGTEAQRSRYLDAQLELTAHGANVHGGATDNLGVNAIDRWWGGTHLLGHSAWRWDRADSRLISPTGAANPEADAAQ
jgi:hypothetical protein